ncbi:hypothetical protein [Rhodococcus qingshengii]|uniref:hypothetical protein n=1 Tax=Rhodococcus qingshengii TaxID=334542 RepID=UPI00301B3B2A
MTTATTSIVSNAPIATQRRLPPSSPRSSRRSASASAALSGQESAIDAGLVIVIAVVLGGVLGTVFTNPLFGAVCALAAAFAFRSVLHTINT